MSVREGLLEEATLLVIRTGTGDGLQLGPGRSLPGRRQAVPCRLCRPHLPEPGFLVESRAGVRVQQGTEHRQVIITTVVSVSALQGAAHLASEGGRVADQVEAWPGTVQAEGLGFLSRWPWAAGGQAGGTGPGAGGGAALPGERPWPLGGTQWPDKALITEGKLQQIPTFPPGEPRGSSGHGGDSPAPHEGALLGELWVTGDHGQHPRGPGPPGRQGCWQQAV